VKVYILESGKYAEEHWIEGVFATPEKAMAAWAPESLSAWVPFEPGLNDLRTWNFEPDAAAVLAGKGLAAIYEFEVDRLTPEFPPEAVPGEVASKQQ